MQRRLSSHSQITIPLFLLASIPKRQTVFVYREQSLSYSDGEIEYEIGKRQTKLS